jgi:chemotaxis protein MotB
LGKKQHCPEFENHERWLVSFADMMTLLFAVFVVLFALKEGSDSAEITQAAGAIVEQFNMVVEEVPVDRRVGPDEAGLGIFEHFSGNQIRPPLTRKFPNAEERTRIIHSELQKFNAVLEERLYGPEKGQTAAKDGSERIVSVQRTEDGFAVRLLATHFYGPNEFKLKKGALPELNRVGELLRDLDRPLTIEGHTDAQPASGALSNWELSGLRAGEIVKHFITNLGFSPNTLAIAGYADTKPIAPNSTATGRALNRRIEIRVHYRED